MTILVCLMCFWVIMEFSMVTAEPESKTESDCQIPVNFTGIWTPKNPPDS